MLDLDSLTFDPVFRPALIAGLALALMALSLIQARRLRALIGWPRTVLMVVLRCLLIIGLALVLMRPMALEPEKRPATRPVFSILIDRSASMDTRDAGKQSRAEAVAKALADNRDLFDGRMRQDYDVRTFEFSGELRPAMFDQLLGAAPPAGESTDIATALIGAAEGGSATLGGMLLVSDGRVNHASGPGGVLQSAQYLLGRKIPVWTCVVGQNSKAHDLAVLASLNQNFIYVRQPGAIEVSINQSGYKGWPATVRLKREGIEIANRQVLLSEGTSQLSFPINEQAPGLFQYAVEVDPLPGEADPENNRRAVFVRATDHRTQVLVVEAQPYWDSKFMLRALRKDKNLEVTSFFLLNDRKTVAIRQAPAVPDRDPNTPRTPPAGVAQTPAPAGNPNAVRIPRTREELFAYDAIILGRGADRIFSAEELKLFKDYLIERGGSLIFARGRAYDDPKNPLAELEPVIWGEEKLSDIRFALTDKGRDTFTFSNLPDPGLMIHELPSMLSVTRVVKEKSLAIVLARTEAGVGDQVAVMAWQRYGKGKVMSLGSAGLWRWSLVPDEAQRYQGVYEEFWSQLVRWLVAYSDFLPNQEVTFEVNRNAFQLGDQVHLTVRTRLLDLKNYHPTLELARRGGQRSSLQLEPDPEQPGVFSCLFVPDAVGEYEVNLHGNIGQPREDRVRFTVSQDATEKRFISADPELMAQVARTTGGEPLTLAQLRELPDRLRRNQQLAAERRRPADAWDSPLFFYLLMGVASLEWLIRRQSGLV